MRDTLATIGLLVALLALTILLGSSAQRAMEPRIKDLPPCRYCGSRHGTGWMDGPRRLPRNWLR